MKIEMTRVFTYRQYIPLDAVGPAVAAAVDKAAALAGGGTAFPAAGDWIAPDGTKVSEDVLVVEFVGATLWDDAEFAAAFDGIASAQLAAGQHTVIAIVSGNCDTIQLTYTA